MSGRIGVELTPTRLRAVRLRALGRGVAATADVAWDPFQPDQGVAALRAALGAADSVALAVGLGLLHVKRVQLPPAPDETRARMIALETARFFADEAPLVTLLVPGGTLAFAANRAAVDLWCDTFDAWGAVTRVDPAPVALVRALGPGATGTYALEAAGGEQGLVSVADGRLTLARRVPATMAVEGAPAIPAIDGADGRFAVALGAVRGDDEDATQTLVSDERRVTFQGRRLRRAATALVAAAAAVVFCAFAFDRWRDRTLDALEQEASGLGAAARAPLAAQQRVAALGRETALLRAAAPARANPVAALAAISSALPDDAVVLNARAAGNEWQIEGTARDAAALVPRLDKDGRFDNVRSLSASSRFRDGNRTRETFTIALRVRPPA